MFGCTRCPAGQDACRRCATRLCGEHVPFANERCAECELAFHESRDSLRLWAWFVVGFYVPWALFVAIYEHLPSWSARSGGVRAITTGVPMLDVVIMFTVMAVFAGKGAMGVREWLHRRKFLAQSAQPLDDLVARGEPLLDQQREQLAEDVLVARD